ncbi:ionotropic receptor 75a-like [Teleopsis dalmanni]|uniref:ionotropic receptor 75a-like n=1 Tax=Teleopsis dalmanni TaxID=139649 RepID=UPI0018CCC192|nr:ionotropic receptor 75a-like [Teleopsis dalmanni]
MFLKTALEHFSNKAVDNSFYTQYINVDKVNITTDFRNNLLLHTRPALGVFLDMNCENSEDVINVTSLQKLFTDHFHWFLYDHQANVSNFQHLFEQMNLSVNADVTYAIFNEHGTNVQNTSYIIYDVYNNGRILGGKLNMTQDQEIVCNKTKCELRQYYSKLHLRPKYGNRNAIRDVTLRVSTVVARIPITLPESELQRFLLSDNDPQVDSIARYGFHLLQVVKDVLKCGMNYTFHDSWTKSECFGGMVGALIMDEADLTSTPFLMIANRLKYLSSITDSGGFLTICMFRTPRNAGIKGDVFLAPFSTTVWCIFGIILIISGLLLWATFFLEYHRLKLCLSYVPSMLTTCLISFGSACSQGSFLIPGSTGGRMVFFSLSLISFFMYNYYTSIVVSILLGSPMKSDIDTLGKLADSNLDVGIEPLPYTKVYLNTSRLPEVLRFVKRKVEPKKNSPKLYLPVEEGIKLVRDKPGFVYIFEASSAFALVEQLFEPHEICDLNEIKLRPDKNIYIQTNKNSTYKELLRLT